eukprot:jgi/Psemu1/326090/estExt_fgenesh1_pg.C_3280004
MMMLDCGAMECGAIEFFSPFPLPSAPVDQSSSPEDMNGAELPIEERLAISQKNLRETTERLRLKQSDYEDMQQEMKFHAIKNEELMDVVNAFRSSSADRSRDIMRAKAEQNSELTLQVHALRDLLTKSGEEVASLQKRLRTAETEGEKLETVKRSHRHLKEQLDDLVESLAGVEDSGSNADDADDDITPEWLRFKWIGKHKREGDNGNGNDIHNDMNNDTNNDTNKGTAPRSKTIDTIRRKITTLDAERQRLAKEASIYGKSDGEKEQTIQTLEHTVRRIEHERDELAETNNALKQQLAVREGKIGALEELFQNINSSRTLGEDRSRRFERSLFNEDNDNDNENENEIGNDSYEDHSENYDDENYEDIDIDSTAGDNKSVTLSFEDIFVNIWTSVTGGNPSGKSTTANPSPAGNNASDAAAPGASCNDHRKLTACLSSDSYHTKQVEEELQAAAKQELDDLQQRCTVLTHDHESALYKISDLTARLEETTIRANSFQKKAGLREVMLRDVIKQYKDLQSEHSQAIDRMGQLKNKVEVLVQLEQERGPPPENDATAKQQRPSTIFVVEEGETPTFDLSERTERTDSATTEDTKDASSGALQLEQQTQTQTRTQTQTLVMVDYQRLETECDRLQHEFDTAIEKINELEEALERAKTELLDSKVVRAEQARTIARIEEEKNTLREAIENARAASERTVDDNVNVNIEGGDAAQTAEHKQQMMRREKDLWELVEQYKQLAEQNESSAETAEAAETDRQLLELSESVTIRQRDLVYEYRKLEKTLEESVQTAERLAVELKAAKNEAEQHEAETKGIRKKLSGCHFHYKQLQEQYEEVVQENEELDRRLSEALQIEQQLASLSNDNENDN